MRFKFPIEEAPFELLRPIAGLREIRTGIDKRVADTAVTTFDRLTRLASLLSGGFVSLL